MDILIFVAIIFFSVIIMVIHVITIRNLNSRILVLENEEKRLKLENKELRDELHFQINVMIDLQRANNIYRKEVKDMYLTTGYWITKRRIMGAEVQTMIDRKLGREISFEKMEEIAFDTYMRNLLK